MKNDPQLVVVAMPNMDGARAYVEFWQSLGGTWEEAIQTCLDNGIIAEEEAEELRKG